MTQQPKQPVVYILQCRDGTLYTGWTNDIEKRLRAHNDGAGAKYTRARRPVTLVYLERAADAAAAQRREWAIKQLSRAQKAALAASYQQKEQKGMGKMPTMDEAQTLLEQYNKEPFHLRHAQIVSGVMRYFAKQHDPEHEEFWAVVGLLHDLDFEQYPDEHCVKTREIMQSLGYDASLIHAVASHGYQCTPIDVKPEAYMEKMLYAVDELTGLIGAVAIMRPSKSVGDLELKSVKKKYKTPAFAAGCSREVIAAGADMLGMDLDALIEQTILAMRSLMGELEI